MCTSYNCKMFILRVYKRAQSQVVAVGRGERTQLPWAGGGRALQLCPPEPATPCTGCLSPLPSHETALMSRDEDSSTVFPFEVKFSPTYLLCLALPAAGTTPSLSFSTAHWNFPGRAKNTGFFWNCLRVRLFLQAAGWEALGDTKLCVSLPWGFW